MHYNDWLTKRNLYTPDNEAVVDLSDNNRYTYKQLNRRANRLASVLQNEFRLNAGDRVAVLSKNCLEMIDLFFACGKLGVIMVPYNFRLPAPAIKELADDCTPSLMVYGTEFKETAESLIKENPVPELLAVDGANNSMDTIVAGDQPQPEIYSADAEDTAMI